MSAFQQTAHDFYNTVLGLGYGYQPLENFGLVPLFQPVATGLAV